MTMQPGFVDDPDMKASHPVRGPSETEKAGPQTVPGFLETGMPGQKGSVDTGWEPETLKPRLHTRGSFWLLGFGHRPTTIGMARPVDGRISRGPVQSIHRARRRDRDNLRVCFRATPPRTKRRSQIISRVAESRCPPAVAVRRLV